MKKRYNITYLFYFRFWFASRAGLCQGTFEIVIQENLWPI